MDLNTGSFQARFVAPARLEFAESGVGLELEQTSGEVHAGETMQSAVWNAGWALAGAMQHPEAFEEGHWRAKAVLEVGSGCGACGIMAARLGAAHVILTDLAPLLPLLSRNAQANGVADRVSVRALDWGERRALEVSREPPALPLKQPRKGGQPLA